jgi:hypothetical protein
MGSALVDELNYRHQRLSATLLADEVTGFHRPEWDINESRRQRRRCTMPGWSFFKPARPRQKLDPSLRGIAFRPMACRRA